MQYIMHHFWMWIYVLLERLVCITKVPQLHSCKLFHLKAYGTKMKNTSGLMVMMP